jgi:hypothetical protein
MNPRHLYILTFIFVLTSFLGRSQEYIADKPYQYQIGVYWNAIDDDGDPFNGLFRFNTNWNMIPLPTSLSFDYHIKGGLSAEALANFNRYKPSNNVNRGVFDKTFVFNLDINAKYAFGQLMTQPFFDPFIFGGISYTLRPPNIWRHMLAPNVGVGFNFFIREDLAIQLRTSAKIGVVPEFFSHHSNYLHHHFGVIYVLNAMPWNQDFSKKRYNWLFKNYNWKGNNRQ